MAVMSTPPPAEGGGVPPRPPSPVQAGTEGVESQIAVNGHAPQTNLETHATTQEASSLLPGAGVLSEPKQPVEGSDDLPTSRTTTTEAAGNLGDTEVPVKETTLDTVGTPGIPDPITSIPPVVQAETSDARVEPSPLLEPTEVVVEEQELEPQRGTEPESSIEQEPESEPQPASATEVEVTGMESVPSAEALVDEAMADAPMNDDAELSLGPPATVEVSEEKVEDSLIENSLESSPQPPPQAESAPIEETTAELKIDTQPETLQGRAPEDIKPSTPPNLSQSEDQPMADAPSSPPKISREREEDEEDEPSAKRTKTEEVKDEAGFKVPELPQSAGLKSEAEDTSPMTTTAGPLTPTAPTNPAGERAMTKPRQKYLLHGLRNLKRTKDATAFNAPVDHIKLNIPNYPNVVTNPMDLGTMEEKLKNDRYTTVEEYTTDLNLVVDNCVKFNGAEHVVSKSAQNLRTTFDKQMHNLPPADAVEPSAAEKKAKKASNVIPKATPARRESRSSVGAAQSPTAPANAGSPTFALGPSGTPLIRRDSTTGDGRPKREIHPPRSRDLPYTASKPKKKKFLWELRFCQEVMNELYKPRYEHFASPFYNPVDPVALNIPHYHKLVKKPMDMGTVQSKLKNGQYENAKEFETDVHLIFNNCYKFNPEGDAVNQMGKQLEGIFNSKFAQKKQWIEDHVPASTPHSPTSSPEPEDEEEDEEDEEDEEAEEAETDEDSTIKILQKQIEAMSKQVELITQKKKKDPPAAGGKKASSKTSIAGGGVGGSKPSKKPQSKRGSTSGVPGVGTAALGKSGAAVAKKDKKSSSQPAARKASSKKERTPYITYEQKQEISNRINTLPSARMSTALNIIRENMKNLQGIQDDELELDIDELSDETLYKLYQFVQKYAPGGEGSEESKPSRPKQSASGGGRSHARGRSSGGGGGGKQGRDGGGGGGGGGSRPKKNKPMSKTEQEARISELQGRLKSYRNTGSDESPEPFPQVEQESSEDEEESGSESEEE